MKKIMMIGVLVFLLTGTMSFAGDNIEILDIGSKIVKTSRNYVYVAWKVDIYSQVQGRAYVTVKFYDDDYELKQDITIGRLDEGTTTVTGQTMIRKEVYKNVARFGVNVKLM
jgi:predicted amino acid-binding ACT domain protein